MIKKVLIILGSLPIGQSNENTQPKRIPREKSPNDATCDWRICRRPRPTGVSDGVSDPRKLKSLSRRIDKLRSDDQQRYVVVWGLRSAVEEHHSTTRWQVHSVLPKEARDTAEAELIGFDSALCGGNLISWFDVEVQVCHYFSAPDKGVTYKTFCRKVL